MKTIEHKKELDISKPQGYIANFLEEHFDGKLTYLRKEQVWYYYGKNKYWEHYDDVQVNKLICDVVDSVPSNAGNYSSTKIQGIKTILKAKLLREALSDRDYSEFLPLQNGVLDLKTKKLHKHSPKYGFTYQLSYKYNPSATFEEIEKWFLEITNNDPLVVELLIAFLNAVLKSRTDLQRYLELIGPGGTGKSTYVRLTQALVGYENSYSTSLYQLEKNKFELGALGRAKLLCVNDSQAYADSIQILKQLTGEDSIRCEVKYQQQGKSINPKLMVVITGNEPIKTNDYTSGLQRRRLTVNLTNVVAPNERRNLISFDSMTGKWVGDFVPYLPGLLNWVLSLSDERVKELVQDTDRTVPSLAKAQKEAIMNTNSLASWLDRSVVQDDGSKAYIGNKDMEVESYLWPNYYSYCEGNRIKPVLSNRFSDLLVDLLKNQLNISTEKKRDSTGNYVTNIRLRSSEDLGLPSIITS